MVLNKIVFFLALTWLLSACALMGVHINIHNPAHPGKMPKFNAEEIQLGEMTPYRSCFDVTYYDLAVKISPNEKLLEGTVKIFAIAETDFDTLQIDLHQNFEILALKNGEDGENLKFFRKYRGVFVIHPRKKGEKFTLEVLYKGKPPVAKKPPWKGGFVWKKDKDHNDWVGVACESEGASIWWPLKDHNSDEPDSMRLHYTVPESLMAIGNGQFEGKETKNGQTTFNWYISYPINTYNVTVYVGKFKHLEDHYTGINGKDLQMDHYVLEPNYEKAKNHFQQLHPLLASYEKYFGEYPWYRDGFKLVESPYEGMEHQTAIAYGNKYKNSASDGSDYIIVHEAAHEWWGNSITASDFADVWLQEGFATYAEGLFFEDQKDYNAYENHLGLYRLFIKNKYPVVGVKDRRWFHFRKSADVYVKGAWILHTLRVQLDNDPLFFEILKSFYEKFKYTTVNSADFISVVNEKTGKEYDWFFSQYLNSNEVPEMEFFISNEGVLFYKWTHSNPDFNKLNVEIRVNGEIHKITPQTKIQKFIFTKNINGGWTFGVKKNILIGIKENKKLLN
ncbi:MAG: M1 family metallopeptidase [Cyclobacteriaceae bacterium]|nr:M1 family metallopeptidase [Cyclobacteriaceae bacterium]